GATRPDATEPVTCKNFRRVACGGCIGREAPEVGERKATGDCNSSPLRNGIGWRETFHAGRFFARDSSFKPFADLATSARIGEREPY
ncbi:MAG: hypothetical protein AAF961_07670, partial [Planctomycetota bacterium]